MLTALVIAQVWSLAYLPDTQWYSQGPPRYAVCQRMFDAVSAEQPVAAIQVGDLVQNGYHSGDPSEWLRMVPLLAGLEQSAVPIATAPGNHDLGPGLGKSAVTRVGATGAWEQHIGPPNTFRVVQTPGGPIGLLALEWLAPDWAIEWAWDQMDANPELPVVVSSHSIIGSAHQSRLSNVDTNRGTALENGGAAIWQKLVEPYPQVWAILSGHAHAQDVILRWSWWRMPVWGWLANAQDDPLGGYGLWGRIWQDEIGGYAIADTRTSEPDPFPQIPYGQPWPGYRVWPRTVYLPSPVGVLRWGLRHLRVTRVQTGVDTCVVRAWGSNHGRSDEVLFADPTGHGSAGEVGLLRFSLPALDPSLVLSARVMLTFEGQLGGAGPGMFGHAMRKAWLETDSWASVGGVVQGVDTDPKPVIADGPIRGGDGPENSSTRIYDVTELVRAWIAGTRPNYGIACFRWPDPDDRGAGGFRSLDWWARTERPMLMITSWR